MEKLNNKHIDCVVGPLSAGGFAFLYRQAEEKLGYRPLYHRSWRGFFIILRREKEAKKIRKLDR